MPRDAKLTLPRGHGIRTGRLPDPGRFADPWLPGAGVARPSAALVVAPPLQRSKSLSLRRFQLSEASERTVADTLAEPPSSAFTAARPQSRASAKSFDNDSGHRRKPPIAIITAVEPDGCEEVQAWPPLEQALEQQQQQQRPTAAPPSVMHRSASDGHGFRPPYITNHGASPSGRLSWRHDPGSQASRKAVCFGMSPKASPHAITPYAQVYGMHPRFFDFDRKGRMQLTDDGVAEELRQLEQEQQDSPMTLASLASTPRQSSTTHGTSNFATSQAMIQTAVQAVVAEQPN